MERLFVDSSVWLAHLNRRDRRHARALPLLRSFEARLVASNFVFDEAVTLCQVRELFLDRPDRDCSFTDRTSFVLMRRLGHQTAATFGADFRREGFTVVPSG